MATCRPSPRRTATTPMVYGLEGVFAPEGAPRFTGSADGLRRAGCAWGLPSDAYGSDARGAPLVGELSGNQEWGLDLRGESALYARSVKMAQSELPRRGEHAGHDAGYLGSPVLHVGWVEPSCDAFDVVAGAEIEPAILVLDCQLGISLPH